MAKVLLVGDDIGAVDIMGLTIEALGYDVVTLYESLDAVECAINEEADLVIVEEDMNIFNGYETASALRGEPDVDDDTPVLMMTRNTPKPQELKRAGINDTVHPESDPAILREILVHHIGE